MTDVKPMKTITFADGLIDRTSSVLDEITSGTVSRWVQWMIREEEVRHRMK